MKKPRTLGEVKNLRLPGYELRTGYLLVLKHGLMGTFPALIAQNDELFVCTDMLVLHKVWENIEKKSARILELQLYANEAEGIGYDVSIGDRAEPIGILSRERFDVLISKKYPFKWAPGLLSLREEINVNSPFI